MRILITSGLSSSDVGGPAQYGPNLKREFEKLGHHVDVMTYGKIERRLPIGIRHLYFALRIFPYAARSNYILALDTFSVGVPTTGIARLVGKRPIVRAGGDFLWEAYVNRTGGSVTLKEFYEHLPALNLKERMVLSFTRWMMRKAFIVFNTEWFRDILIDFYDIDRACVRVIRHPVPERRETEVPASKHFLWAGRTNKVKQVDGLRRVWKQVEREHPEFALDLVSGEPHSRIMERLSGCYAAVLPSLSDTCPFFILEAAALGKPFIVTRETGLRELIGKGGVFVDSKSESELRQAFLELIDRERYDSYRKELAVWYPNRDWTQVAREFMQI